MGSSVIFSGTKVKTLKSTIDLNGGNDIISSTTDPTSVAVSANIGSLLLNSSSGKLYRKNDPGSSTNWSEVGSGQSGINYISNPSADTNTTGWATYADAAGAQPVDGTGGSPTVTWSRSTTTPLRGSADFNFVKDANNRQGEGVSTDFTIANADLAKVLTITADYEVVSGTYATGDLTVYIVQDPASTKTVIQPAGYQIQALSNVKSRIIATFQTDSTLTGYRLCFHVASTSASAYTLAFDNVVVGPQVVQYGAPITDWVAYTPTTQGLGTITSVAMYWRRNGSDLEIMGNLTTGTVSGSECQIGLPAGLTSSANISTIQQAGTIVLGAATSSYRNLLIETSKTYLTVGVASASSQLTKQAGNTFANTSVLSMQAQVPIAGWSSTVQMSNDTDTRVVAASAYISSGASTNDAVQVNFDTVLFDTHGAITTGAGAWKYTCPVQGYYKISCNLYFGITNSFAAVYKNGSVFRGINAPLGGTATGAFGAGTVIVQLNAGDYIDVRNVSGSARTPAASSFTGATIGNSNFISIERLSGPSAIAASEGVIAKYSGSVNATASTTAPIQWNTKQIDTHSAVTTGTSWKFTTPISGVYLVTALYATTSGDTTATVYKNGSSTPTMLSTLSATYGLSGSALISLLAGDYIDIRAGGSVTILANTNYSVNIVRVGNYA